MKAIRQKEGFSVDQFIKETERWWQERPFPTRKIWHKEGEKWVMMIRDNQDEVIRGTEWIALSQQGDYVVLEELHEAPLGRGFARAIFKIFEAVGVKSNEELAQLISELD